MKTMRHNISGIFAGLAGMALLVIPIGCVVEEPRPVPVVVAPAPPPPVFIERDDYIYYPRYQVYYGSRSGHYYYQDGRAWVARPAPRGVSIEVLRRSPTVRVDFHDAPPVHHAEVVRTYPRRWRPDGHR